MPEEPHHITRAYNASISRRGLRPFLDTLISREDKEEVEFEGYSDSDESQNTEPPCAHPTKSQRIYPVLLLCAIILIFTILIPFLIPSSAHSITALGYTSLPSKWTLSLSLDTTNHICNSRSLFSTYMPFRSDTASTRPHCAGTGTILLSYQQENSKGNGNKTTQGVLGLYNVCHLSRPWWRRQRNTISLPALRAADIDTRLVPSKLSPPLPSYLRLVPMPPSLRSHSASYT